MSDLNYTDTIVWTKYKPKIPATIRYDTEQKTIRSWNPFKNSLSAAIMSGLEILPITPNTSILYVTDSTQPLQYLHLQDITKNQTNITVFQSKSTLPSFQSDNIVVINDLQQLEKSNLKFEIIFIDDKEFDIKNIMSITKNHLIGNGILIIRLSKESVDILKSKLSILKDFFYILQDINIENYFHKEIIIFAKTLSSKKNRIII